MSYDKLTILLAKRVMGWGVGPDRFLMGNRSWMPRWRFQPTEHLQDAFRLLEKADPQEFTMVGDEKGIYFVRVQVRGAVGEARDTCKPRAITFALARALGFEPSPDTSTQKTLANRQ
jgi:hypothetical protein